MYVLIPENQKNKGTGHLKRMSFLYQQLKNKAEVYVYLKDSIGYDFFDKNVNIITNFDNLKNPIFIIDKPQVSKDFIKNLSGFVVGIDTGGNGREFADYLIDILPNNFSYQANEKSIRYLNLFFGAPKIPQKIEKILVSFGGEDPNHISKNLYDSKILKKNLPDASVFLLIGNNMSWIKKTDFYGWYFLDPKPNLNMEFFREYDCIFTAFGLSLFESLSSGVPAFIINHDDYNKSLSDKIKIESLGVLNPKEDIFKKHLKNPLYFKNQFFIDGINEKNKNLANFILDLKIEDNFCKVCKKKLIVKDRFKTNSMYMNCCKQKY